MISDFLQRKTKKNRREKLYIIFMRIQIQETTEQAPVSLRETFTATL